MDERTLSGAPGCALLLACFISVVAGLGLGGLYCGENDAILLLAAVFFALGPIAVGVTAFRGFGGGTIVRAAIGVLGVLASFAALVILALLINLAHCPLF